MLRYRHSDMEDLEKQLARVPEQNGTLIVTDGVFSMGGDIARLPEICALAKKYGARVMVDDAHGLGVLGDGGRGTASFFGLEDQVDVYMGTFSKSLASLGGYMAASGAVAEYVRHASVYILRIHSSCQLRHSPGSPAQAGAASGAAGAAAGAESLCPQGLHRPGPQNSGVCSQRPHTHHPHLYL